MHRAASLGCNATKGKFQAIVTFRGYPQLSRLLLDFLKNLIICVQIRGVKNYLPVEEVRYTEEGSGSLNRSMRYVGSGSLSGTKVQHRICIDQAKKEIKFILMTETGTETDFEVVNALVKDEKTCMGTTSGFDLTPRIMYFKRRVSTKERVWYDMPRSEAVCAIDRTAEIARVVQRSYGNN